MLSYLSKFSLADTSILTIIFFALGGLGLFFYGMNLMSSSLKNMAGTKLKDLIQKTTKNPIVAMLIGIAITLLTQSSSATSVIVVGLITAGLMTFNQAIPVLLGSNIGSTFIAFIIGMNLADYSLPIIFVGAIILIFISTRRANETGGLILGIGILFLGIDLMGTGLKELGNKEFFTSLIMTLSDIKILGFLLGTGLTALIQSSGAFIGIIQKLYESGSIPLGTSIVLILGSNIGTTITGIIASISGTKEARKTAISNCIFKTIGVIIFFLLLNPFTQLCDWFSNLVFKGENNMIMLALIHVFYNACTTILILVFLKFFIKILDKIFPVKQVESHISATKLNYDLLTDSPVFALEQARRSIIDMSKLSLEMIKNAKDYVNDNDIKYYQNNMNLEEEVDVYDHLIHDYLMQLHTENLSTNESINQAIYLDTIRDLERIGDHAVNLVEFLKDRYDNNINTDQVTLDTFNEYFQIIYEQVDRACKGFETQDANYAHIIIEVEDYVDTLERKYRQIQLTHINQVQILSDIHYVDILSNLERVSDHCCNIAENIIDPYYMKRTD